MSELMQKCPVCGREAPIMLLRFDTGEPEPSWCGPCGVRMEVKSPDIAHLLRDGLRDHLLSEGMAPTRAEEITNYLMAVADAEGTRMRANRLEAENERLRTALATLAGWDMLTVDAEGHGTATADAPWARALIAEALDR